MHNPIGVSCIWVGGSKMSKRKAIWVYCLSCSGSSGEVRYCSCKKCPLHPFRLIKKRDGTESNSLLEAIRQKCVDCCCDSLEEVRECSCTECPLHPFRSGKDPTRVGIENSGAFPRTDTEWFFSSWRWFFRLRHCWYVVLEVRQYSLLNYYGLSKTKHDKISPQGSVKIPADL